MLDEEQETTTENCFLARRFSRFRGFFILSEYSICFDVFTDVFNFYLKPQRLSTVTENCDCIVLKEKSHL